MAGTLYCHTNGVHREANEETRANTIHATHSCDAESDFQVVEDSSLVVCIETSFFDLRAWRPLFGSETQNSIAVMTTVNLEGNCKTSRTIRITRVCIAGWLHDQTG